MVPPFLAYYGIFTNDTSYVKEAVAQCELYCEILRTESGCWKHIVNQEEGVGRKKDEGLWSTSNGWAAAGMCRVLATIKKSRLEMKREEMALVHMIRDILDGAMKFDTDSSGLLRNRLDDETWFGDAAGTALLAATVLRVAVLEPEVFGAVYSDWAVQKMETIKRCVDEETGIVGPVVNPTKDDQRTPLDGVSPEAQAFVVLLNAAWRDWKAAAEGAKSQ
jgi:rhamnogalacturonyl hydrolase YesR